MGCECFGCSYWDNACGYRSCSECGTEFEREVPVHITPDEGRAAIRLCGECIKEEAAQ